MSTILDPWYKPLINVVQVKSGRDELLRMLKASNGHSDSQRSNQFSTTHLQEGSTYTCKKCLRTNCDREKKNQLNSLMENKNLSDAHKNLE